MFPELIVHGNKGNYLVLDTTKMSTKIDLKPNQIIQIHKNIGKLIVTSRQLNNIFNSVKHKSKTMMSLCMHMYSYTNTKTKGENIGEQTLNFFFYNYE